jgi:hypothetical protein
MAQMRGFFPLPPGSPQNTGTAQIVTLPSGGVYYMQAGEYIVTTGGQTVIQWYDALGGIWRNYAGPNTWEQISADGGNYRLVNLSGVAVGCSITNAGSGGTNGIGPVQTGATVTFAAPAAGGALATAQGYVVVGGTVPAPTVTQGGSGFVAPPLVCCDPPPQGGVQATFTSTISAAGVLTGVTQQNPGAGYTSIPQFYIIPQPQFYQGTVRFPGDTVIQQVQAPGLINPANVWTASPFQGNIQTGTTGALLTGIALTGTGTLTAIVMTAFGNGYAGNTVPAISFTGGGLAGGVAATAIMSFCMVAAIGGTVTASGGAAQIANTPSITSLGMISGGTDNNQFFPRPARGINSGATGSFTLEDPGFGLQGGAVFVNAGTSTTVATVTNTQYGGRPDTSVLQPMVQ